MTVHTARADVATDADRYAKQLMSHLGHQTTWTTEGEIPEFAGGTGRVVVGDGILTLVAEAPDRAALVQVQHVLGSHLERFAQRQKLRVSWVSDADPIGPLRRHPRRTTSALTAEPVWGRGPRPGPKT